MTSGPVKPTHSTTLANWSYRKAGTEKWTASKHGRPATQIHVDLLDNGEIPDPFLDENEKLVQWVADEEWEYQAEFTVSSEQLESGKKTDFVYEGLDTVATVYLNDKQILHSENMFHIGRVDITKDVKVGTNNVRIFFANALIRSRQLEKIHGKMRLFNGETSRVQLRKSQYHYGWDWGPLLMTSGPYRPVKIETYNYLVSDVFVNAKVSDDLKEVTVSIEGEIEGSKGEPGYLPLQFKVDIKSPSGEQVVNKTFDISVDKDGVSKNSLKIENPQLWYPANYGEQHLYHITVDVVSGSETIQSIEKDVGFRKVELIQRPLVDQEGTTFFFQVNNIPIYCAGGCWIPAHSFTTCLTNDDYKKWIKLMIDGHQNMVRIWGGGIYEEDIFYQECDRLGIMVWQDFMFACGQYPGYPEFLESVSKEAVDQLKRLRNYCSIVLYAGNNEDYQVAEAYPEIEYDPNDTTSDYLKTNFPARHIYEKMFPELVADYSPAVPYHPGSPWGGKTSSDPTIGDIHQWNVWHGNQEKYQDWYKLGGRFVSEFGMEALPDRKTVDQFVTKEHEKYPQSRTMDLHNKSDGFERRLALYVMENIKVEGMDIDNWIYATQLMQSECLAYAYRCWRRQWKGPGREYCAGALVWQVNDCWPVTSWAIVDFYYRPKLSYYAVKRESSPVWIGMYRNVNYLSEEDKKAAEEVPTFDYFKREHFEDIWGVNNTIHEKKVVLHVEVYEIESGKLVETLPPKPVTLKANQTTEIIQNLPVESKTHHVVYCRLVDADSNKVIARGGDWPQPLKYLSFPDRQVKVKVEDGQVRLSTNKPVKGVEITVKNKDLFLEDNGIDLFPGDDQTVIIRGLLSTDEVTIRHY
ncbi:hypothetical protein AWJ20_1966 [Sugiyamaella lignohabitans]|uniref:Beta-mannosidase B n=1 Tax=Sugiyamaella lignohabitans TaxID=796027 RepID=A0A167ER84_9ASCO|nr:uncharacterized protein AWJ20_1966 [Sugiyamaella lignohabitans]ANB14378.1 hypothetical protein AWJ20_1966 [Sugiyamaella lignohabitans]